ncbi:MAG TPA: thermonuclease family protein [Sinorhizobium sp.]|nr:thermonuclease family protein [Sinorhizobium sp.]
MALLIAGTAQATRPIVGDALVIDGDTIEISGERIQLSGVDAPEGWQVCLDERGADYPCGEVSAQALDRFLSASRPTRCEFVTRDRYGRFIGTCFREDGKDVNHWLVSTGNAVERENQGAGLYASAQEMARSAGAGIWRGQPKGERTQRVAGD